MGFKTILYKMVVFFRKIYYQKIMNKPRIVFIKSNLLPYGQFRESKYLNSFR